MRFEFPFEPADVDTLCWTTFAVGSDDYLLNSDVNPVLIGDNDPGRPVRSLIHEGLWWLYMNTYGPTPFANGNRPAAPPGYDPETWYLASGDSLPPGAPITDAEAAWIATLDPMPVDVDSTPTYFVSDEDAHLLPFWVEAACAEINAAAGREMLRR
jgi:hypothetical protein